METTLHEAVERALAAEKQSREQAEEARKWRARAQKAEAVVEAMREIAEGKNYAYRIARRALTAYDEPLR